MNTLRYMNTILTVIAVLLAMHLYTAWTDAPMQSQVHARTNSVPKGGGLPNAGAQRKQTVDLLKRLNQQTGELVSLFRGGKARVRIEGAKPEKD